MHPDDRSAENPVTTILIRIAPAFLLMMAACLTLATTMTTYRDAVRGQNRAIKRQLGTTALTLHSRLSDIQRILNSLDSVDPKQALPASLLDRSIVRFRYRGGGTAPFKSSLTLSASASDLDALVNLEALLQLSQPPGPAALTLSSRPNGNILLPLPGSPHTVLRIRYKPFSANRLKAQQASAVKELTCRAWTMAATADQTADLLTSIHPTAIPGFVDAQLLPGSPPPDPSAFDIPLPGRHGSIAIVASATPPPYPTGTVAASVIGVIVALGLAGLVITPARELGDRIRESRNRFRAFMDGIPDPVFAVDRGYRIVTLNKAAANLAGRKLDGLVGDACHQALFRLPSPCPGCRLEDAFDGVKRLSSNPESDDEPFDRLFFHQSPDYPLVIEYLRDRSTERELRGQLDASEREAQMGRITATIAHDLRNPLVVIAASAEALKGKSASERERTLAGYILDETRRLDTFTRQLLQFSKPDPARPMTFQIHPIVESAVSSMAPVTSEKKISLEMSLDSEIGPVRGDPDHIRRILINLLDNCCHFAGEEGDVYVTTGGSDRFAWIQIEDGGPGIPEDKRGDIWRPFYTTRGDGTGLGLAIASRLAQKSGGSLSLIAPLKLSGAAFRLELPLASRSQERAEYR